MTFPGDQNPGCCDLQKGSAPSAVVSPESRDLVRIGGPPGWFRRVCETDPAVTCVSRPPSESPEELIEILVTRPRTQSFDLAGVGWSFVTCAAKEFADDAGAGPPFGDTAGTDGRAGHSRGLQGSLEDSESPRHFPQLLCCEQVPETLGAVRVAACVLGWRWTRVWATVGTSFFTPFLGRNSVNFSF